MVVPYSFYLYLILQGQGSFCAQSQKGKFFYSVIYYTCMVSMSYGFSGCME